MSKKLKNPLKVQCKVCKKIIFSSVSGRFTTCDCENYVFIDQTEYYCRIGGDASQYDILGNIEELENELQSNRHQT